MRKDPVDSLEQICRLAGYGAHQAATFPQTVAGTPKYGVGVGAPKIKAAVFNDIDTAGTPLV